MKIKLCRWLTVLLVSFGSSGWSQAASTIQFTAANYTVAESTEAATLTVQRAGDLDTGVGVDYAAADGTAANGLKYMAVSGTLAFAAGETSKNIGITNTLSFASQERLKFVSIPILNNSQKQASRNFRATLAEPLGVTLGSQRTATVENTDRNLLFSQRNPG